MKKLVRKIRTVLSEQRGATSVEYALIAAIIVIGIIGWATMIGGSTNDSFQALNTQGWGG
jgi:pilus assembly protein Flp/PilA